MKIKENAVDHFNESFQQKPFANASRSRKIEFIAQCWCKHEI